MGVEGARVEGRAEAELGEAVRPAPCEEHRELPGLEQRRGPPGDHVASGVGSSNSTLNACRSRAKAVASAAPAGRIGNDSSLVMSDF
jgi:hypothetical protein